MEHAIILVIGLLIIGLATGDKEMTAEGAKGCGCLIVGLIMIIGTVILIAK